MQRFRIAATRARDIVTRAARRGRVLVDRRGSVGIVAVAVILALVLACAFTLDLSNAYLRRLDIQRTADLATLAAARMPGAVEGTQVSATAQAVAASVARLNGASAEAIRLRASPASDDSSQTALVADVTDTLPLLMGGFVSKDPTLDLSVEAWASIDPTRAAGTGDCIRSHLGPVNIYNKARVSGPNCFLGAASYLYVCQNAAVELATVSVKYAKGPQRPYVCASASIKPGPERFAYKKPSTDVLASDSRIKAIKARLDAMTRSGWPYGSRSPAALLRPKTPSGPDRSFASAVQTIPPGSRLGSLAASSSIIRFQSGGGPDESCEAPAASFSGSLVLSGTTRLILDSGCYAVGGGITAKDDARVTIEPAPGAQVTLAVKGAIVNERAELTFGDMDVSVAGDIRNADGGMLRFGRGKLVAGAGIVNSTGRLSFGGGPFYVNGGTITNGAGAMSFGKGPFYLWGGSLSNASTGSIDFDDGPFYFYGGTVYNVAGRMRFGKGPFQFQGGTLSLSHDSVTSFGVGDLNFYGGSVTFGGRHVTLGEGGSAETGGSSLFLAGGSFSLPTDSMTAIGTTFAFGGGTISLYGAGRIEATAPTADAPALGYRDIVVAVFGGAFNLYKSGSAPDILSGIIYVPRTNTSIYGKTTVRRPPKGCLQVAAGIVDIYQDADLDMAPCSPGRSLEVANRTRLIR